MVTADAMTQAPPVRGAGRAAAHARAARRRHVSACSSSAAASPASAPRSGCARTAATTSSSSSGAARSAAPGATTPTRARPATSPRTCTRTPSSSTRTGRARSPRSREIQDYLRGVAAKYDVGRQAPVRHRGHPRPWDAAANRWLVDTTNGNFSADVLVGAVGALCEPNLPDIKGIENFRGEIFHSARWNHDADARRQAGRAHRHRRLGDPDRAGHRRATSRTSTSTSAPRRG